MSEDQGPWNGRTVAASVLLGGALAVAGSILTIVLAGHGHVRAGLSHADWPWLLAGPICVLVSHTGYVVAYRQASRADPGPELPAGEAAAIVASGFGPLSVRGGFAMDAAAFRHFGLSRRRAASRIKALGMLEYAVLTPVTYGAALFMWLAGRSAEAGVLPSWIIGVPAGTAIALIMWFLFRRAGQPQSWWSPVRNFLVSIEDVLHLLRSWPENVRAVAGMSVYWAADIGALAACAVVFTHRHSIGLELIVGYATGYALTRRTLPLAGAGIVEAMLPFALHWVGYPLATAVLTVLAYRLFNLWFAIIPAVFGVRRLQLLPPSRRRSTRPRPRAKVRAASPAR